MLELLGISLFVLVMILYGICIAFVAYYLNKVTANVLPDRFWSFQFLLPISLFCAYFVNNDGRLYQRKLWKSLIVFIVMTLGGLSLRLFDIIPASN